MIRLCALAPVVRVTEAENAVLQILSDGLALSRKQTSYL